MCFAIGADDGVCLQRLQLLPLWCAPGPRWPAVVAAVLRCAQSLSARLQTAVGGGGGPGQPNSFLEELRAHLHRGASAQVPRTPLHCHYACDFVKTRACYAEVVPNAAGGPRRQQASEVL